MARPDLGDRGHSSGLGETDREFHAYVQHDPGAAAGLPDKFRVDHDTRDDPNVALSAAELGEWLAEPAAPIGKVRPVLLGAVPMFDATRLFVQSGLDSRDYLSRDRSVPHTCGL